MSAIDPPAPSDLRALAEQSNAWRSSRRSDCCAPEKESKGRGPVLDRLWPVGAAAYRHFRRGPRTTMVRHAFRVLTEDKIKTGCSPSSDDMTACARWPDTFPTRRWLTAYLGKPLSRIPDPFSNEYPSVRRAQQCAAARVPRHVRVRLRIRQLDRLLHVGQVRRGAAARAGTVRCGHA